MRQIVHHELGDPVRVLTLKDVPAPVLAPGQVRVRTTYVPIHPGDLLGVMGSPAFGSPPEIGPTGRVPGFEGVGVVTELGPAVDPTYGIAPGMRVAFFPANAAWSEEVAVSATSVVPLPVEVPDEVGAQMLVNIATAQTVIRAAHDSLPSSARNDVVTLLTAAGSAVGRLISRILIDNGVLPIRLVRSEQGAAVLARTLPGTPVFATETPDWKTRVRETVGERKIYVAIDSVGGRLLGDVAELLADGEGTVVNFGSLGGETSDIRIFPPRSLTLKGVVIGNWFQVSADKRKSDIALALRLAGQPAGLFDVAARYPATQVKEAVAHVGRPGRVGAVLLHFPTTERTNP